MNAPYLNRALTLEAPVQVPDGAGGYTADWDVLGVVTSMRWLRRVTMAGF